MNRAGVIVAWLLLTVCSVSGGASVPFYRVTAEVECSSPAAAAAAELKFLPLPEGRKVAFSCRWDDSTPSHSRTLALMKRYGYKGTFYLTGGGRKNFWEQTFPELCKDGFTVGNHTDSHRELPLLTPDGINCEILKWNVLLESRADQPVTVFVAPYGKINSAFFPGVPEMIGSCLQRSGIIGCADISPDLYKFYGLKRAELSTTVMLAPGDREPGCSIFDSQIKRRLEQSGDHKHITLGIHSLHTDKGLKQLGESLAKYGRNPQWWYCNENEYAAYRFMVQNSRITGKKVNGKKVTFTLEIPDPAFTGSTVPLWAACGKKQFPIRHSRTLPEKIDLAAKDGRSSEFPGLTGRLSRPSGNRFVLILKNSGLQLENVTATLRLPPGFKEKSVRKQLEKVGKNLTLSFDAVRIDNGGSGREFAALQLDFTRAGKRGRLWITHEKLIKPENIPFKLFCTSKKFSAEEHKKLALPQTPLADGFTEIRHTPNWQPGAWLLRMPGKLTAKDTVTAVLEFQGGGKFALKGDLPKVVLFNGRQLKHSGIRAGFDAPAGKCRILVIYPPQKRTLRHFVLFVEKCGK